MTWTRALAYVAVWLLLTGYYVISHRDAPLRRGAPPAPEAPTPALSVPRPDVVGLVVESNGLRVRAALEGAQWSIVEPPTARVPSDLIAALASTLVDAAHFEVVGAGTNRDAEFGLDHPATFVTIERTDGTSSRLALGGRNPAETAVYARSDDSPETILLGLNAEYYIRLVLQAAKPS